MKQEWSVPATVERVVDADTLDLVLDLGWRISLRANCRLIGLNAPEMSTAEGKAARTFVEQLLPLGSAVRFVSKERDKYGRPLGVLLLADGTNLNALLLEKGYAVPMKG